MIKNEDIQGKHYIADSNLFGGYNLYMEVEGLFPIENPENDSKFVIRGIVFGWEGTIDNPTNTCLDKKLKIYFDNIEEVNGFINKCQEISEEVFAETRRKLCMGMMHELAEKLTSDDFISYLINGKEQRN